MKKYNPVPQYLFVCMIALLFFGNIYTHAQVKDNFTPRFSESVKGDMTMIANNMLSRNATANYNGGDNNDSFTDNVFVDIDNDNTTFNSSNATFNKPKPLGACLNIKKAYLYWAAADYEEVNPLNEPNWNYNQVKIMLPNSSSYTTITADEVIYRGRDDNGDGITNDHFVNDPYICFKEITNDVIALNSPYGI